MQSMQVRERCNYEWGLYSKRWEVADALQANLTAQAMVGT